MIFLAWSFLNFLTLWIWKSRAKKNKKSWNEINRSISRRFPIKIYFIFRYWRISWIPRRRNWRAAPDCWRYESGSPQWVLKMAKKVHFHKAMFVSKAKINVFLNFFRVEGSQRRPGVMKKISKNVDFSLWGNRGTIQNTFLTF